MEILSMYNDDNIQEHYTVLDVVFPLITIVKESDTWYLNYVVTNSIYKREILKTITNLNEIINLLDGKYTLLEFLLQTKSFLYSEVENSPSEIHEVSEDFIREVVTEGFKISNPLLPNKVDISDLLIELKSKVAD